MDCGVGRPAPSVAAPIALTDNVTRFHFLDPEADVPAADNTFVLLAIVDVGRVAVISLNEEAEIETTLFAARHTSSALVQALLTAEGLAHRRRTGLIYIQREGDVPVDG